MGEVSSKLTVFFEDPFWVGVFENIEEDMLYAAKVIFGSEPKDYEVYAFIMKHYYGLRFSPAVEAASKATKISPKRMQRDVKKQLQNTGIGTKSQQALKLLQEQSKQERKAKSRDQKLADAKRMFALKQQKKKEKHRGH